jgi:hypothetical protein
MGGGEFARRHCDTGRLILNEKINVARCYEIMQFLIQEKGRNL